MRSNIRENKNCYKYSKLQIIGVGKVSFKGLVREISDIKDRWGYLRCV